MTKLIYIFSLLFAVTLSFAQSENDLAKIFIGKWTIEKIDWIIENNKKSEAIKDTMFYEFRSDSTYTFNKGDDKITSIGKWLIDGGKVKLYDISQVSEANGIKPINGLSYHIELKVINMKKFIFVTHHDKDLNWTQELYYIKNK